MRAELETFDPASLAQIVRRALGEPTAEVDGWRVEPIAGGATGANLYRVCGSARLATGAGASAPWSLVVKRRAPPRDHARAASDDWRRAVLAHQLGLLPAEGPFPGLVAARCLAVMDRPDGSHRLWTEDLSSLTGGPWTAEDYARAARHFGRFNAVPLAAGAVPSYPWFFDGFLRYWCDDLMRRHTLSSITAEGWRHPMAFMSVLGDFIEGPLQRAEAWDHPLLRAVYPEPVAARTLRLWQSRHLLLDALDRLPRTLIHGDAHVFNLFRRARPDGEWDTVAIDWDTIGLGPLGEDAGRLLGAASWLLRSEDTDLRQLYESLVDAYLAGVAEAYASPAARGPSGNTAAHPSSRPDPADPTAVRFAIAATAALAIGFNAAAVAAAALGPCLRDTPFRATLERLIGRPAEDDVPTLARSAYVLLDLADEAFALLPSLPGAPRS